MAEPIKALPLKDEDLTASLHVFGRALLGIVLDPRTLALHRLMVAEGGRFPELAHAVYQVGHHRAALILSAFLQRHRERSDAWGSNLPSLALAQQFISLVVAEPQLRSLIGLDALPVPTEETSRIVDGAVWLFLNGLLPERGGAPHA
ncbi:TetR/AcrR family transcriptional regulator C-terminal domain-containing protein [Roseomonas chloroacetimidivorans]|uniref:TetR/AcrR family transcriptional regulator C-terminal domain-containing protein n=1 Tax=Roseomonas chloroacetimidivorans TaxID=1766656 RepID=UPI003C777D3C